LRHLQLFSGMRGSLPCPTQVTSTPFVFLVLEVRERFNQTPGYGQTLPALKLYNGIHQNDVRRRQKIMNQASCLSLLSNAVLVCDTVIVKIIAQQRLSTTIADWIWDRSQPSIARHVIPQRNLSFQPL
jgi:hypothetical protein